MNIVEVAIFIGLPTCLAFCFFFPLRDGVRLALTAGLTSALVSALILLLFGSIYRLLRKRWPDTPVFKSWACIAFILTFVLGFLAIRQSRMGLLGIPATVAAVLSVAGPRAWRKVAWACFVAAVLASAALRVFSHLPVTPKVAYSCELGASVGDHVHGDDCEDASGQRLLERSATLGCLCSLKAALPGD